MKLCSYTANYLTRHRACDYKSSYWNYSYHSSSEPVSPAVCVKELIENRISFLCSFKHNCLIFLRISVNLGVSENLILEEGGQRKKTNQFLLHTCADIQSVSVPSPELFYCRQTLHSTKNDVIIIVMENHWKLTISYSRWSLLHLNCIK